MKGESYMLVFSFKMTKTKLALFVVACIAVIAFVTSIISKDAGLQTVVKTDAKASNNEERIAFLSTFGWQVEAEPSEIIEIVVPLEFDAVYEKYNSIQKGQGYDLLKYKGKRVKRYTYEVKNYEPKQETKVNANILVCDNKIVGGDVCSVALGGFIHGFKKG